MSVEIPNSITEIRWDAFNSCVNLKRIDFEDGESTLKCDYDDYYPGDYYLTFSDCPLEELYLGRELSYRINPFEKNSTITILYLGKFIKNATSILPKNNDELVVINCYNPEPPQVNDFTNIQYANIIVNIPIGSLEAYKSHPVWGCFWNLEETDTYPIPDIKAREIILNIKEMELYAEDTVQLEATVLPELTTNKTITWQSSNNDVATVNETGLVTAISVGEAQIFATCGEAFAVCNVTVLPVLAESIALKTSEITIAENDTFQLVATITPENVTDPTIVWTSSNDKVAKVSVDGLVTGISIGEVDITATCGDVSAICKVTVIREDDGVEIILSDLDCNFHVFSVDGVLIRKECNVEDLQNLPKGIYFIVTDFGKSYKVVL